MKFLLSGIFHTGSERRAPGARAASVLQISRARTSDPLAVELNILHSVWSKAHERSSHSRPRRQTVAQRDSAITGPGDRAFFYSIITCGLERCSNRFDEADDPGR